MIMSVGVVIEALFHNMKLFIGKNNIMPKLNQSHYPELTTGFKIFYWTVVIGFMIGMFSIIGISIYTIISCLGGKV